MSSRQQARRRVLRGLGVAAAGMVTVVVCALAQQTPDSVAASQRRPTKLEELVTTAARGSQAVGESPLNVTAVTRADLTTSTALSVPNLLWRIPGFAMRDYQSSVASTPVRGVVSFRGMGGSSAGRTLVLLDGVPLNEPFSGWLHWNRVPLALVDRVEIVRGGGSMLWGSRALGGVINVLTAAPEGTTLTAVAEGGGYRTYRGALAGSVSEGNLRASLAVDLLGTEGFVVVRPDQTGPADVPSGTEDRVIHGKLSYDVSPAVRLSLSGNYLGSESTGPTEISDGSTGIGELRAGLRVATAGGGVLDVTTYGSRTSYDQVGVSVSSDRTTMTPNRTQSVPASSSGASVQWSQIAFGHHHVTAGVDVSSTDGVLTEGVNYRDGGMTLERETAGRQLLAGAFLQDHIQLSDRWRILAGLRQDVVRNEDGVRRDTELVTGAVVRDTAYPASTDTRLNFSLGVRHDLSASLAWRASLYRAFRAPTPYEFYYTRYSGRGQIVAANPSLRPERLFGAEIGADLSLRPNLLVRATVFWNEAQDPVVDYTIGTATATGQVLEPCGVMVKDQVCRQRQNVEGLTTTGIESEVEFRPGRFWSLWGSYAFNPTRMSAPGQQIDGAVARGAARHAASAVATWDNPRLLTVSIEERYVSSRSDDDLDTIRLDSFLVTGVRVTRRIWAGSDGYVKIDNLFDAQYPVTRAANGLEEVGAPRWVTIGIRAAW